MTPVIPSPTEIVQPVRIAESHVGGRMVATVWDAEGQFVLSGSAEWVREQVAARGWRRS